MIPEISEKHMVITKFEMLILILLIVGIFNFNENNSKSLKIVINVRECFPWYIFFIENKYWEYENA